MTDEWFMIGQEGGSAQRREMCDGQFRTESPLLYLRRADVIRGGREAIGEA